MPFNADAVTLTLLVLLAALIAGVAGYAGFIKARARRAQRDNAMIRSAIVDYFRRSGVEVAVDCTRLDNGAFTALLESEPMKRFRLSHIIEMTLSEHVRRTSGLHLDKVYWRFPIKEATQAAVVPQANPGTDGAPAAVQTAEEKQPNQPEEAPDDYINEGLENYRNIPKPEVTELPWETFEEVSTIGREKKDEQAGQ